jgi:hypothetical protein
MIPIGIETCWNNLQILHYINILNDKSVLIYGWSNLHGCSTLGWFKLLHVGSYYSNFGESTMLLVLFYESVWRFPQVGIFEKMKTDSGKILHNTRPVYIFSIICLLIKNFKSSKLFEKGKFSQLKQRYMKHLVPPCIQPIRLYQIHTKTSTSDFVGGDSMQASKQVLCFLLLLLKRN